MDFTTDSKKISPILLKYYYSVIGLVTKNL